MPERVDAFAANLYTVARQAAEAAYRRAEGERDEQLLKHSKQSAEEAATAVAERRRHRKVSHPERRRRRRSHMESGRGTDTPAATRQAACELQTGAERLGAKGGTPAVGTC